MLLAMIYFAEVINMQVNLGEKIKELRKREGRKQEDLAKALGVTSQAVSRWEANGGYPDMGMIPSIANFFHITIDELFGYNNDREKIIQEYNDKALIMLNHDSNMTNCIALLRRGLEEFPTAIGLKIRLAAALNKEGWNHRGEMPNKFWEEAASLYEELLEYEPNSIIPLLSIYGELGEYEKAEKKAQEQTSVDMSREVLLGRILGTEKEEQYRGEAVIALLHELRLAFNDAISQNDELNKSQESIDIFLALRSLYEKVFGQESFGYHSDFCFIDMALVKLYGNRGNYDKALYYFDSAFEHYSKFRQWWEPRMRNTEVQAGQLEKKSFPCSDRFETIILKHVNPTGGKLYLCEASLLEYTIASFPDKIKEQLKCNSKYADIFIEPV